MEKIKIKESRKIKKIKEDENFEEKKNRKKLQKFEEHQLRYSHIWKPKKIKVKMLDSKISLSVPFSGLEKYLFKRMKNPEKESFFELELPKFSV